MKPRILQKGAYMPALDTALTQEFDVLQLWRETNQDAFLTKHGSEFVGLATSARCQHACAFRPRAFKFEVPAADIHRTGVPPTLSNG